ncbi:hypothetical protein BVI1335_110032 [Burkholderia vietnamiensis]|nr:hypothetical protein BVI1335_110032 [Burkholderia vietnamiensis]
MWTGRPGRNVPISVPIIDTPLCRSKRWVQAGLYLPQAQSPMLGKQCCGTFAVECVRLLSARKGHWALCQHR